MCEDVLATPKGACKRDMFESLQIFLFYFTESQNHKTLRVGRDLCGSSSPTLLPKQGHLQQAAQSRS